MTYYYILLLLLLGLLPAIVGLVPDKMVQAILAFMDFCYLARQSPLDEGDLEAMANALNSWEEKRTIFVETGVCPNGISIPHLHSLKHYISHIQDFGAPNGLCSSITESKHIRAVKRPWRRSNHHEALGQMLLTNQRLDKLAYFQATHTGMWFLVPVVLKKDVQAVKFDIILFKNFYINHFFLKEWHPLKWIVVLP